MSERNEPFTFDGFAIIEFMGHRKRAGKVRTADLGGTSVFVVETSTPDGQQVVETYNASSLYCLTPVTEAVVAIVAKSINPAPIAAWDLPDRVQRALREVERQDREKAAAIEAGEEEHHDDRERERSEAAWDQHRMDAEFGREF